jgi:hypothetical protein
LKGELWKRNGNFEKEIDKLRNEMSASEQEKKSKDQMLVRAKNNHNNKSNKKISIDSVQARTYQY